MNLPLGYTLDTDESLSRSVHRPNSLAFFVGESWDDERIETEAWEDYAMELYRKIVSERVSVGSLYESGEVA